MKKKQFVPRLTQGESGIVLPLFAMLAFVFVAMLAFVIDHSKETLAVETLQRAADVAALSAVRQLDSTVEGWRRAKDAAVIAVKRNGIHGTSAAELSALALNDSETRGSWNASGTQHPSASGHAGGLSAKVERGTVWFDRTLSNGRGGYAFKSLEGDLPEHAADGFWRGSVPTYLVANAVRVTLKLDKLPTTFGQVLGVLGFENLTQSALAVTGSEREVDVAPLAVPYCQLILDTNVNMPRPRPGSLAAAQEDHLSANYEPAVQQQRELVFTEANPKFDLQSWSFSDGSGNAPVLTDAEKDELRRRRNGLTRFESFIREPYVAYNYSIDGGVCSDSALSGPAPSCKHFPIYGTLGRPSDRPGDKTRAGEVAGLFAAARDGRLRARLGDYFAPLENLQDQTGDVANATLDAAQYINSGDKTYQDIFTIEPPLHVGNNFPLMRTLRPESAGGDPEGRPRYDPPDPFYDLRLSRPTKLELGDAEGPLGIPSLNLMLDYQRNPRNGAWPEVQNTRQPMAWSNPLCHAEEVGLANDLNQRVRTAKVMVIAPHKENPANAKYCDFRNVFRGQPQNAIPPVADSWPVVVGMIEVNLFDLNFRDLDNHPVFKAELDHYRPLTWVERLFGDDRMISTVTPHYPSAGVFDFGEIVDRHPSELLALPESVLSSIEQARNQIGNFQPVPSCTDCSSESNGNGNSGNSGNSQSCEQCQANAASTQSSNNNLLTSLAEQGFPVSFFWCFDLDDILDVLRQTPGLAECANEMEATEVNQCLNDKKVDFNSLIASMEEWFGSDGEPGTLAQMTAANMVSGGLSIRTRPHSHCLPQPKLGAYDLNDPNSFEPLSPLYAGRGCGGMRARVVHDTQSKKVWSTGGSHVDASPALVQDNAG